jgi:arylsulfatase A-like enzyme
MSKRVLFLLLMMSAIEGCWEPVDRKPAGDHDLDVDTIVLVTIDTWRRDANGFIGGLNPSPTPFLDALAATGLVAEDAMAPVPLTAPSHWSMLTGRWPWRDGVHMNGDRPRNSPPPILAELFRREGWKTGGFVSCSVLDHRFGFARGFDHFDDRLYAAATDAGPRMTERRGDATVSAALNWVGGNAAASERLFLWLHLFDAHYPYESPSGGSDPREAYMGEVAFVDAELKRLSEGLKRLDRPLTRSGWLVIADHGEALGVHGEPTHGLLLHGATTRIPALLAGPGVPVRRDSRLTATVDVFATLLDYAGIDRPDSDGRSWLSSLGEPDRAVPMESFNAARAHGLAGVTGLRWQEWLWEAAPADRLFDLESDPEEEFDLAEQRGDLVATLRSRRAEYEAEFSGTPEPISQALQEELIALGYAVGTLDPGEEDVRDFAKEGLQWHAQFVHHLRHGNYVGAEELAARFLDRYDRSADMWQKAGLVAVELGRDSVAEDRFRRAIALAPNDPLAQSNLGTLLADQQRWEEAEHAFQVTLQLDPENLNALKNLGLLHSVRGRREEAAEVWKRFLELYPEHQETAAIRQQLERWHSGQ